MYEEAIAELQKAVTLSGGSSLYVGSLARVYALAGKRAKAQEILDDLKKRSDQEYISAFNVALIYSALDEKDRAFEWLEKAIEERDFSLLFIKVDPELDSLRSDPRLTELLKKMGLE